MSGETESDVSGWTVDTLGAHLDRRMHDMGVKLDERYATQTKAVEAALAAQQAAMHTAFAAAEKAVDRALEAAEKAVDRRQNALDREYHEHLEQVRHENALAFLNSDKAVQAALASAKEATHKAELSTEKRFEAANGFRAQLSEQAATFMPREVADAAIAQLRDRVLALSARMDTQSGRSSGYVAFYGWAVAAIGLIISVVLAANTLT